jgi:hypothetical protein
MLSAAGARNIRAVNVRKKIQSKSAKMDHREESCNDETDEQNSDDVFQRSKPSHRHRRTSSFETIRVGMDGIKQKGRAGVDTVKQSARNIRVVKVRKERSDHRKESDAEGRARAAGLDGSVQDAMNRWRKIEQAKGRRPRFNMVDHYSHAQDLMPVTWRYSFVQ